jgi:hypothetical protein
LKVERGSCDALWLKGVLGLPYVPEVLFYELLDSVRGYLLDGDLLFAVCTLA